jgi:hypothetical protein
MKATEFRKLIREELKKVLSEATLISKGKQTGAPAEIKVNDYVRWYNAENERGMSMITGVFIGKVVKILGSKNMQVEVVSPSKDAGDIYKVTKNECLRIPRVGETISATVGYDGGAGSGSQGTADIRGTVAKVDLEKQTISVKSEEGKVMNLKVGDLSKINIIS